MGGKTASGFTLVELVVTVSVMGILAALAFPSFESTLRSNRVSTANNELIASIALARSEAIRSSRSAGICAANATGAACGTDWNLGWLVWTNNDADPVYAAGTDTLVRYVQPKSRLTLTVPNSTSAVVAQQTLILFDNRGRAMDNPTAGRVIALKPDKCPTGEKVGRTLTLNGTGQINSAATTCTTT